MFHLSLRVSFMLAVIPSITNSFLHTSDVHHHHRLHSSFAEQHHHGSVLRYLEERLYREQPPCEHPNGTEISGSNNTKWTTLCNVDFLAQDIYPFILAGSFDSCHKHCEKLNDGKSVVNCQAFIFAPERSQFEDDCYLKSAVENMIEPTSIHLVGAILQPSISKETNSSTNYEEDNTIIEPRPKQNQNTDVTRQPRVTNLTFLGSSTNNPTTQYVNHTNSKQEKLIAAMLTPGLNVKLITDYPLAGDTGTWTTSSTVLDLPLADMKAKPRLSRDGGKGGKINGTNIFLFSDTATYGNEKDPVLGYFNGFVSSSVAIDQEMNGLQGKSLTLIDTIGQWQDDVGRMRGLAPMTTGEQAFNKAVSGQGYRYAVWPQSSPIHLNQTHTVLFAPLVYLEVDMESQARPNYTTIGNTLLVISIDSDYGPHADRLQNQFFTEDEISWGSLGGVREWGVNGRFADGGRIYLFGQVESGIMVARVSAAEFGDRSKYTYWNGGSWDTNMPPPTSSENALMVDQPVMDLDVFYSPFHKTFIMVYLTPDADNTFYYRSLRSPDDLALEIIPAYDEEGDPNYVEQILRNKWSEQKILFNVSAPERGYIYAGGVHSGYFGDDDITEGGTKMLCTWTEHTNIDPNKPESGYAHKAQVVELGW